MRKKDELLGGWQEEMVTVSQRQRLGFKALVNERAEWTTRFRVRLIWVVAILAFAVVAARVTYLHIFDANQQLLLSETNHIEQVRITAKRGSIVDKNGVVLAESVLKEGIATASPSAWVRNYPLGPSGSIVLGYMSEVTSDELGCLEGLCYGPGMLTGRSGIEKAQERRLRGNDGGLIQEIDAKGNVVRERGRNESEDGAIVKLTLDSRLQSIAYRAMDTARVEDKSVKGAVVVMSMQGEILALVSYPTYDPAEVPKYLSDTTENYFLNRATTGQYPPGSVFKMVTAYAGLASDKIESDTEIEDIGEIKIGDYRYGTWNFDQAGRKEGNLSLTRALSRSNDIYFYRVGELVGVTDLVKMARKFGLGSSTGIEIGGEAEGLVPDPLWKERRTGESWFLGNTYHLSIGQGDLLTTPLQVARMSVASVTGRVCRSKIVAESEAECTDLGIPTPDIEAVKEGMRAACATGGTAYPFFSFEPYVLCKTGTAQHAGQIDEDDLPHAWITVAYPGENPELVITVLVESGGEGSAVAGPIAKQILDEWKGLGK
ncbi:hypothetical protein KBD69_03475 [Candidatus Woesebacteria bacterium]|nr:hypothetical protein [Candidatus Woesebacteria bacterium]